MNSKVKEQIVSKRLFNKEIEGLKDKINELVDCINVLNDNMKIIKSITK